MSQTDLTIRELRVRAVKVPMAHPHKTASGTITESPLVLTDVLTEQGVVGHSKSPPSGQSAALRASRRKSATRMCARTSK